MSLNPDFMLNCTPCQKKQFCPSSVSGMIRLAHTIASILSSAICAGICRALLEEAEDVPILGVCLGMQALAHVHGGQVVPAPCPIHGRLSEIRHNSNPIFSGIPSGWSFISKPETQHFVSMVS